LPAWRARRGRRWPRPIFRTLRRCANPENRGISLIALTGWGQDEDRLQSRDAGFDAHMVKPVDHDKLLEFLAALPPAGTARHAVDDGERSQPIDR